MNRETRNFPALMIVLVQRAASRMESLIFGNDVSFLPQWFSQHVNDQRVETHVTIENVDKSLFIMPCNYNLN